MLNDFSFCLLNFIGVFVIMFTVSIPHCENFVEITLHIFERMIHLCKKTDTLAITL